jgi:hypothetical protein
MSKVVLTVRVPGDLVDEINQDANSQSISQAEWIRDAIESYLGYDENDVPTLEEVQAMEWDELRDLIKDFRLKIKPKEYDSSKDFIPQDDDEDLDDLRDAVAEELGLTEGDDDDDDDDDL